MSASIPRLNPSHSSVLSPLLPSLAKLYAHFADHADCPSYENVAANEIPEPYRWLLVHTHHMTVTVERFYSDAVNVQVLDSVQTDMSYARKILLTLNTSHKVVQFGIVHIDLALLSPIVRDEIVAGKTPLGRVLIQHNVFRVVQPVRYFRAVLGSQMAHWFGATIGAVTYGRLGVIYTDGQPAIHVAEILAPIV